MSEDTTPPQPKRRGPKPGSGQKALMRTAAAQAASLTGKLPHEILLDIARGTPLIQPLMQWDEAAQVFKNMPPTVFIPDMQQRMNAARDAAPYYAPKLSAIELLARLSDSELDELIRMSAAEAGLGVGPAGEGAAPTSPPSPTGPDPGTADPRNGDEPSHPT